MRTSVSQHSAFARDPSFRPRYRSDMSKNMIPPNRSAAGSFAASKRWESCEQEARKIASVLKTMPRHSTRVKELIHQLKTKYPSESWSEASIRCAVQWSRNKQKIPGKSKSPIDIRFEKGGKTVQLVVAGGRHPKGAGQVGQALKAFNGARLPKRPHRLFVVRAAKARAFDTHASIRSGKWSSPDFIVCFFSSVRSRKPKEVHSFELQEPSKNVSAQNLPLEIAQSFACSSGYQRCWFMIHDSSWKALNAKPEADQLKRAERLAKQLGVGIIVYRDARKMSTWKRIQKPRPLSYAIAPSKILRRLNLSPLGD